MEVKEVALKIAGIDGVEGVILFGSVARGGYTKKSDIDLLIIYQNSLNKIQDKVLDVVLEAGLRLEPIFKTLDELRGADVNFITNVLQDAKIMFLSEKYGLKLTSYLGFAPYTIFSYETSNLLPKDKTRFYRSLFGARWSKGKKVYSLKGLLEELKGKQLGRSTIMVSSEHKREIEQFLDTYAVEYREQHVFVKQ